MNWEDWKIEPPPTPVELYHRRRLHLLPWLLLVVLLSGGTFVYWRFFGEIPVDYGDDVEHFKYGSIGSDSSAGIPYWIWQLLPEIFPDYLPETEAFKAIPPDRRTGLDGYKQFGFIVEEGRDTPIGFSKRRVGMVRVGLNCAVCHVSTVRAARGMAPERIYGEKPRFVSAKERRVIVLGMPANTLDLHSYFRFLLRAAADARFTASNIMAYIESRTDLGFLDRIIYRRAVPLVREQLLERRQQLAFLDEVPAFGPGRVDTFNPYKTIVFGFPYDGTIGTADFPSLWNQRPREGLNLHWDGNNASVFERNISAALGAGATPVSLDIPRMLRVAAWTGSPDPRENLTGKEREARARKARARPFPAPGELKVPKYPFLVDRAKARRGEELYRRYCGECHAWQGEGIGQVVPIEAIGTDPDRWRSYDEDFAAHQGTLGSGQWWRFTHFRKTAGYTNMPLDGLWTRAPYLHNGSVPTLRDLLARPEFRPKTFYRGDDEYDPINVGFRSDRDRSSDGRRLFLFDTSLPGNDNGGHLYGTHLSDADKASLLEYLKVLDGGSENDQ